MSAQRRKARKLSLVARKTKLKKPVDGSILARGIRNLRSWLLSDFETGAVGVVKDGLVRLWIST